MKKSELRQIIREEILKENLKDFDKFIKIINKKYPVGNWNGRPDHSNSIFDFKFKNNNLELWSYNKKIVQDINKKYFKNTGDIKPYSESDDQIFVLTIKKELANKMV